MSGGEKPEAESSEQAVREPSEPVDKLILDAIDTEIATRNESGRHYGITEAEPRE